MGVSCTAAGPGPHFLHEAFFYASDDDYLAGVLRFIDAGLDRGEPVLVALPAERLALVRRCYEPCPPALLSFAEMEELGANPARIIPAWRDFLAPHLAAGRRVRGVGEPIWAARGPDELAECVRHEALLNVAFADAAGFELLCPYDLRSLGPAVIAGARANHPYVRSEGHLGRSEPYVADVESMLSEPLRPMPAGSCEMAFDQTSLAAVRNLVASQAAAAGVAPSRIDDLVTAVGEAIANTVLHGGGHGSVAAWATADRVLCEVRDGGRIVDPLAGRIRPPLDQIAGRGLWIMQQLCDLVQVRLVPGGQVVRLHLLAAG